MLHDLIDPFTRTWTDINSGRGAPLAFRFILQPAVAAFFAVRAGREDARARRPFFFWALLHDKTHRLYMIEEGWRHIGKVFVLAAVMDCIYQVIELRWIYPGQALMMAVLLAVIPYLFFRGAVNRILSKRTPVR
jgi:hypothetical protein